MSKKSKKKSKKKEPKQFSIPTAQDLFGSSRRYKASSFLGPRINGYEFVCAFENKVPDYTTATMQRIGNRGNLTGAWGGRLINEEWVIFDNQQATVDLILLYKAVENTASVTRTTGRYFYATSREPKGDVRYHPCKRDGKLCMNAFGTNGCVKKGISTGARDYFEYCSDYQVSLIHRR